MPNIRELLLRQKTLAQNRNEGQNQTDQARLGAVAPNSTINLVRDEPSAEYKEMLDNTLSDPNLRSGAEALMNSIREDGINFNNVSRNPTGVISRDANATMQQDRQLGNNGSANRTQNELVANNRQANQVRTVNDLAGIPPNNRGRDHSLDEVARLKAQIPNDFFAQYEAHKASVFATPADLDENGNVVGVRGTRDEELRRLQSYGGNVANAAFDEASLVLGAYRQHLLSGRPNNTIGMRDSIAGFIGDGTNH